MTIHTTTAPLLPHQPLRHRLELAGRIAAFVLSVAAVAQVLHLIDAVLVSADEDIDWSVEQMGTQVSDQLSVGYISLANDGTDATEGRVLAATIVPYQAELTGQSVSHLTIDPGRAATIDLIYKNTGTATWTNNGPHFIALNVTNPTGRTSPFRHAFWKEYAYRPARLLESTVRPGETGHIRFAIQAPQTEGLYREDYALVAENTAWLPGGEASITIDVGNAHPAYDARLTNQSHTALTLSAGETTVLWAEFQNVGSHTWSSNDSHFLALNVTDPAGRVAPFHTTAWPSSYRPAVYTGGDVATGQTTRLAIPVTAPEAAGRYTETYQLVAENHSFLPNGRVTYTITVEAASQSSVEPEDLRVGITSTDDPVTVTGTHAVRVVDRAQHVIVSQVPAKKTVRITHNANGYTVTANGKTHHANSAVRVEPLADNTILTVTSYENRPAWNPSLNDNMFRGVIEVRYSSVTDRTWIINELPFEQYLKGVAESSNDLPAEFHKALVTAERTYALYHYEHASKHASEYFHVDATYDQVYKGYGFELRSPNVTAAVRATRGMIVTYDGELAITPYFSRSDGHTRSWEDVWAGNGYPWLVSVDDPYCDGDTLYGHGVGMSAKGALGMAQYDDASYEDILAYYYTGTSLQEYTDTE